MTKKHEKSSLHTFHGHSLTFRSLSTSINSFVSLPTHNTHKKPHNSTTFFSILINSKVSKRKISKKSPDKCVHCYVKIEVDNLKDFVTCKGCGELACHNSLCSEFIYGLDVWECARCKKNR